MFLVHDLFFQTDNFFIFVDQIFMNIFLQNYQNLFLYYRHGVFFLLFLSHGCFVIFSYNCDSRENFLIVNKPKRRSNERCMWRSFVCYVLTFCKYAFCILNMTLLYFLFKFSRSGHSKSEIFSVELSVILTTS